MSALTQDQGIHPSSAFCSQRSALPTVLMRAVVSVCNSNVGLFRRYPHTHPQNNISPTVWHPSSQSG